MTAVNFTGAVLQKITFTNDVIFLFERFHITTTPGLIFACFIVINIATVLSILRILKKRFQKKTAEYKRRQRTEAAAVAETNEKTGVLAKPPRWSSGERLKVLSRAYWIQSAFAFVNETLSSVLILILVTYNGWLILSVLIGVAIGYSATLWMDEINVVDTTEDVEEELF